MTLLRWALAFVLLLVLSCKTARVASAMDEPEEPAQGSTTAQPEPSRMVLPPPAPLPPLPQGFRHLTGPDDNQTTPEKVELGFRLFFDQRLSADTSMACVECHHIDRAYASGNIVDGKVGGGSNKRNSLALTNVGYQASFYWDGRGPTLEAVCGAELKWQLGAEPAAVAQALNEVRLYQAMFERAFGEPATVENVPRALAAWLRELKNGNSPWDKFQAGDSAALSREAQEGAKLFQAKGCEACHVPPLFSDDDFHNLGLGDDPGRKAVTKLENDTGKFKTPSLRNVALTAPYFHDGQATTLEEAIAVTGQGGTPNRHLDANLRPRKLTPREAKALKAFLESLTGESTYGAAPALP